MPTDQEAAAATFEKKLAEAAAVADANRVSHACGMLLAALKEAAEHGVTLNEGHLKQIAAMADIIRDGWPNSYFGFQRTDEDQNGPRV
jgi:hypothetical protein